ncbi:MSMEG_0570 family nitrogen starvation response protein [Ancylobacter amanitiformis]|uniref:Repeat protein (TIGR04042 family) n=1 Tax=Ancylobacter amanitiformis TaxID=217069 RepID=A0ABU0LR61_9HYPH|nr:MSMEG_0570 family nitrogen starvation response protein [Ancylobacter amanitiformis]MDQ0511195.1 putative repeat protein (TIGR04042 family) [Ancylobacter amanitiformis]
MPEMTFTIRWPDGTQEHCYSPSLVIKDYFAPGASYPLADFLGRSREALTIASDRVAARYGFSCSRALGQLARLEAAGGTFSTHPDARVVVESFDA